MRRVACKRCDHRDEFRLPDVEPGPRVFENVLKCFPGQAKIQWKPGRPDLVDTNVITIYSIFTAVVKNSLRRAKHGLQLDENENVLRQGIKRTAVFVVRG